MSPEAAARSAESSVPTSLLRVINVPLRYRTSLARWTLACGALAAGFAMLRPREYQSQASFFPQGGRLPGNVAGLAAQFGIAVPAGGEATRSPEFYANLVRSHGILRNLVVHPFVLDSARPGVRTTLLARYGAPLFRLPGRTPTPAEQRERAIVHTAKRLRANVAEKTGVVTLSVSTDDARLSRDVVTELLAAVNRFNQQTRRTQAGAERHFAERRLVDARLEQRRAEDRLEAFLQGNRELAFSPALQLQRGRLADQVSVQRQLVLTLTQSYEQARMEEVRDTPVITVMETPELAARPQSRQVAVFGLVGALLGLVIGTAVGYLREYLRVARKEDAEGYAEFQLLRGEVTRGFRAPVGRRGPARGVAAGD